MNSEVLKKNAFEKNRILYENQSVILEGVPNARQLGGYICADGRAVKKNVLFRSGELSDITDEGLKKFSQKYNIKTVIDFRMKNEIEIKPNKHIDGVKNIWISVMNPNIDSNIDSQKVKNAVFQMNSDKSEFLNTIIEFAEQLSALSLYKAILSDENAQKGFAQFFDILLNNEDGAVLWHCSQGKDRTGLAAALLLFALGADKETVLNDFELSLVYYRNDVLFAETEIKNRGYGEDVIKAVKSLIGVDRECLEFTIDFLEEIYGSVYSYINNQLNVSDEHIKMLRNKYLE